MDIELLLAIVVYVLIFIFALLSHVGVIKQRAPLHLFGANGAMVALFAVISPLYVLFGLFVHHFVFNLGVGGGLTVPMAAGIGLMLVHVIFMLYLWYTPKVPAWSVPKWYRAQHPDQQSWSLWYQAKANKKG